ncbi:hypothetical protein [Pseudoalteromonas phage vB_PtuP_Slicky01]|nr:hypothetical protein [Pseudoalteromonas phage vB_PtuP_Slicky01]
MYTVTIDLKGKVEIIPLALMPMECKGTSLHKANLIKEEIENNA